MKCFVASSFGRQDVDAVYDSCVIPALKRLSIQPLRVDRVEHNHDIDDMIMRLLREADVVVADLTYARPSVYFEAGYAAGMGKPVVYTARSDHFRARDSDPEGLLRVHFDLQMKNIVPWSAPNHAFSSRLEKRLRHVTKPLTRIRESERQERAERADFASLSQDEKLNGLGTKARNLLGRRGFAQRKPDRMYLSLPQRFAVYRENDYERTDVAVICQNSFVKKDIETFRSAPYRFRSFRADRHADFHLMAISLKTVPQSRRSDALTEFRTLDDGAMYHWSYAGQSHEFDDDLYVHFLDGVGSVTELADRLRTVIRTRELELNA